MKKKISLAQEKTNGNRNLIRVQLGKSYGMWNINATTSSFKVSVYQNRYAQQYKA